MRAGAVVQTAQTCKALTTEQSANGSGKIYVD